MWNLRLFVDYSTWSERSSNSNTRTSVLASDWNRERQTRHICESRRAFEHIEHTPNESELNARVGTHRERYRTCVLCNFISRLLSRWLRECLYISFGFAFLLLLHSACACACMCVFVRRPCLCIPTSRIYCMNKSKSKKGKECFCVYVWERGCT